MLEMTQQHLVHFFYSKKYIPQRNCIVDVRICTQVHSERKSQGLIFLGAKMSHTHTIQAKNSSMLYRESCIMSYWNLSLFIYG